MMKAAAIPTASRTPRPTLPQPDLQPLIFSGWGAAPALSFPLFAYIRRPWPDVDSACG